MENGDIKDIFKDTFIIKERKILSLAILDG